jgi:hypothetical protein
MKPTKIVKPAIEIDLSDKVSRFRYHPSYIALFDPEIDDVIRIWQATKEVFIFIFITDKDKVDKDWGKLPISNYIVRPIYVGMLDPDAIDDYARDLIRRSLDISKDPPMLPGMPKNVI